MDQSSQRTYVYAFLLSIIFHIFLVLLLFALDAFASLNGGNAELQDQPIVLEFEPPQAPAPTQPEEEQVEKKEQKEEEQEEQKEEEDDLADQNSPQWKPVPFFHENPNAVEAPNEEALIMSDKASRSAAPDLTETGDAFAPDIDPGSTAAKGEESADDEVENVVEDNSDQVEDQPLDDLAGDEVIELTSSAPTFSRNKLIDASKVDGKMLRDHENDGEIDLVQKKAKAQEVGDFRLSTYDWNYEPWLGAFVSKLGRVWHAPFAYYMGLVHGYTVIRFKVNREGKLLEYEVLEHSGHGALNLSSVNAIESTFPFRELPEHFPHEVLEITATLVYPDAKKQVRRR